MRDEANLDCSIEKCHGIVVQHTKDGGYRCVQHQLLVPGIKEPVTANDRQVGGDHYRTAIQPWDFVLANGLGFLEGNAVKYISRHRKTTTGKKDLEKAIHYLQKAIEFYYDPEST